MGLKGEIRDYAYGLRESFLWLGAREDMPKGWFKGAFSRIKWLRFSMVVLALLNVSFLLFAYIIYTPMSLGTMFWLMLWLGIELSVYIIVAMVFLLGFRMWYAPSVLFFFINLGMNYFFEESMINDAFNPIFSAIIALTWLYLIACGLVLMMYDKGSKLNDLLAQS